MPSHTPADKRRHEVVEHRTYRGRPAAWDFLGCMVQPSHRQRPGAGPGMKCRSKVVVVLHKRQCRLHHQAKNMVSVLIHAYLGLHAAVLIHVKLAMLYTYIALINRCRLGLKLKLETHELNE
jgi:hypothetical protein